jgi:hypothetical protein
MSPASSPKYRALIPHHHRVEVKTPNTVTQEWDSTFTTAKPHSFLLAVTMQLYCRLSGIVVSVLATGPEGWGFKPGRGDGFLRAIKIRSTPFFGWEVKPEVPCHKIYSM